MNPMPNVVGMIRHASGSLSGVTVTRARSRTSSEISCTPSTGANVDGVHLRERDRVGDAVRRRDLGSVHLAAVEHAVDGERTVERQRPAAAACSGP
jgi:hypothetical protein